MTTPWWQQYLDGRAGADTAPANAPEFVDMVGITPAGWEPGTARLLWEPPPATRTPGGWVQGGFLGVVLDMAQTFAVFTKLTEPNRGPMTLEMTISYIDSAFAPSYIVTGRSVRLGRHVAHAEGDVRDADGKLIATSTSTHVIRTFA